MMSRIEVPGHLDAGDRTNNGTNDGGVNGGLELDLAHFCDAVGA
jgi:hypothetical protein